MSSVTPLIPRSLIFGNPERASPQLSPDGRQIAFLAPRNGVMNIYVASSTDIGAARPLTEETERPIRQYYWSRDSSLIGYLQDVGGTEDFLLYMTDVKTGETRNLTPFEKTRVQPIVSSIKFPDEVVCGINNRDPRWHDLWRINIKTGERRLIFRNEGHANFVLDDNLRLRFASRPQPDGGFIVDKFDAQCRPSAFMVIPGADSQTTQLLCLDIAGTTLYGIDSRGRDTAALVSFDLDSAKPRVLAENARSDVGNVLIHPRTFHPIAYLEYYLTPKWHAIDPAYEADGEFLSAHAKGPFWIVSQSHDGRLWIVSHDPITEPAYCWLYDREAKTLKKLFTMRPKLEGAPLAAMYPREIKSRDGLTLTSYLSLPRGADADGNGKPDAGPLPMVLNIHGGPWARDGYGSNGEHQWLANRGYAVLSVNFRGSAGFGKTFLNAGDREWGRKMHDDLIDAVDWAVAQDIADKDRIAIMGGSYGGYAALAGVTMTPEKFACGVDVVGPSNLQTLLGSIPPYWASFFENLARRVGDPRTEEGKALLKERSPLTYADRIVRPLLIGQGANDPRVKQAEADQIVNAMKAKSIPVTYVLYPTEGHGFAGAENRTSFSAIAEAFLSAVLGGRFEPIGKDLDGANFEVPEGVEHVPGLAAAIKARRAATR